jgi:hypothetical protein
MLNYFYYYLLFLCRWPAANVVHIASMFKDILLSSDELLFIMSKVMRMLPETDPQTLPPLIYQLLLLSAKVVYLLFPSLHVEWLLITGTQEICSWRNYETFQTGRCSLQTAWGSGKVGTSKYVYPSMCFMQSSLLFFSRDTELAESDPRMESLHLIEGTVLLHVTFAVKQDRELGRNFLKILKVGAFHDCACSILIECHFLLEWRSWKCVTFYPGSCIVDWSHPLFWGTGTVWFNQDIVVKCMHPCFSCSTS